MSGDAFAVCPSIWVGLVSSRSTVPCVSPCGVCHLVAGLVAGAGP